MIAGRAWRGSNCFGLKALGHLHGYLPVLSFTDNFKIRFQPQDHYQALANYRMIIHNQNPGFMFVLHINPFRLSVAE